MHELEQAIKTQLGIIDSEDLNEIRSLFHLKSFKKDDFFLKTGERCTEMFFIKSGLLRVFVYSEKKEITQWIATPGYFVTDLSSFISEKPARWNFQTLTDLEIFSINKSDYNKISQLLPIWNELEKKFLVNCFTTLEDRIFSHLSMTAEERYHFFFSQNKELFNLVPLQYIASMLGMTPETFSRIRKKHIL